jgi:hypothetical protein
VGEGPGVGGATAAPIFATRAEAADPYPTKIPRSPIRAR